MSPARWSPPRSIRKLEGAKLLLVQPLTLEDTPRGPELLAVDGVGAGVHEKVLIVLEGRSASDAIGQKTAPVDAAIVGIVDSGRSPMNEQDVRALVREAIERHLGRPEQTGVGRGFRGRQEKTASRPLLSPSPSQPHPADRSPRQRGG